MGKRKKCNACGGRGYLAPVTPSCVFLAVPPGFEFIERCDECKKYASDQAVVDALEIERILTLTCASGGWHVAVPRVELPGQRRDRPGKFAEMSVRELREIVAETEAAVTNECFSVSDLANGERALRELRDRAYVRSNAPHCGKARKLA